MWAVFPVLPGLYYFVLHAGVLVLCCYFGRGEGLTLGFAGELKARVSCVVFLDNFVFVGCLGELSFDISWAYAEDAV
jgi:hypothetical protein